MTQTEIDPQTFAELQETAGADFVRELVETFLVEAPLMLAELRDALAARSVDRFRRAAHSLKSNTHTCGARARGAAARDLAGRAAVCVAAAAARPLDALAEDYARVATALAEMSRA